MRQRRTILAAVFALLLVWGMTAAGFAIARNAKPTAEKLQAELQRTSLKGMTPAERAAALARLANQVNSLPNDERRRTRRLTEWQDLFKDMTEEEKGQFLEATLPSGFKQIITAFEELPEDRRKKTIQNALQRLQEGREAGEEGEGPTGPGRAPLSEEMQKKVITTGLKTFYGTSSAQTKAELAPLLEELQQMMEKGALARAGRQRSPEGQR